MLLSLATLFSLTALDLRWNAPDGCALPDLAEITAGASGAAAVRITNGRPNSWAIDLTFLKPFQGTRHLELTSCADANRAARALLVLGLRGADAFLLEDVATSAPPAPPPPQVTTSTIVVEREGARISGGVRTGAVANLFGLPGATPRFFLAGVLRVGAIELELGVRTGVTSTWAGGPTTTAAVSVWPSIGGELAGCFGPRLSRFRPAACALLVAERWELAGLGVTNPASGVGTLVGIGGRARLGFSLGAGFEVGILASLLGVVRRPVAEFEGVRTLAAGAYGFEAGAWLGFAP